MPNFKNTDNCYLDIKSYGSIMTVEEMADMFHDIAEKLVNPDPDPIYWPEGNWLYDNGNIVISVTKIKD